MNTQKKNQHYIPKFYLRNFSINGDTKQIGVYNLNNEKFIRSGSLKHQGSRNFFYGYDGVVEEMFANAEGYFASIVKNILSEKELPRKLSLDYFRLLLFITMTDLRNPVVIEGFKFGYGEMRNGILQKDNNADIDRLTPLLSHDEIVRMCMETSVKAARMIMDLDCKLLLNKTTRPFISSNYPVIKYNQYLESKKWAYSVSGYGLTGIQLFIPLNFELMLVFYDSGIYKVGDKKKNFLEIVNEDNVDDLNLLQFVNCLDTIYFDHRPSKEYITSLHSRAKNFLKANISRSTIETENDNYDPGSSIMILNGKRNFVRVNKTECQIGLTLDGFKVHSRGKTNELTNDATPVRPFVANMKRVGHLTRAMLQHGRKLR